MRYWWYVCDLHVPVCMLPTVSDNNKKGSAASTSSWVGTTAKTDSADLGLLLVIGVNGS